MSAGMIGLYSAPALCVNARVDCVSAPKLTLLNARLMEVIPGDDRICVFDLREYVLAFKDARIPNLPAGFRIKRCSIQNDLAGSVCRQRIAFFIADDDSKHARAMRLRLAVTCKLCARQLLGDLCVNLTGAPTGLGHRGSSLLLELAKCRVELLIEFVFRQFRAVLTQHDPNQVSRDPVGVVGSSKLNHRRRSGGIALEQLSQPRLTNREDTAEALLLATHGLFDEMPRRD